MEDLILRLHVEEDHKKGDKNEVSAFEAKTNFVEGNVVKPKKTFQKTKARENLPLMDPRARNSRYLMSRDMYMENQVRCQSKQQPSKYN